jgi:tetratricopeptide (TPR) repeat protein
VKRVDNSPFELISQAVGSQDPTYSLLLCDEILSSDSAHLPAIEIKAKNLWRMGRFDQALSQIDQAIALYPFDPGYHFLRGDCLQQLLRFGEAVLAFERCLDADDSRLKQEAESRIQDLEEWQEQLVAELLRSDVNFRREYTHDAPQLLRAHGFAFSTALIVRREQPELRQALWARPS